MLQFNGAISRSRGFGACTSRACEECRETESASTSRSDRGSWWRPGPGPTATSPRRAPRRMHVSTATPGLSTIAHRLGCFCDFACHGQRRWSTAASPIEMHPVQAFPVWQWPSTAHRPSGGAFHRRTPTHPPRATSPRPEARNAPRAGARHDRKTWSRRWSGQPTMSGGMFRSRESARSGRDRGGIAHQRQRQHHPCAARPPAACPGTCSILPAGAASSLFQTHPCDCRNRLSARRTARR